MKNLLSSRRGPGSTHPQTRAEKWIPAFAGMTKLWRCQQGSAIPIVALGIFTLIGATGVAVDMGRVQIVQSRMQNALDAAGLAVGSEISTANITTETGKYFFANFPANYLGTTITSGPSATPNADNSVINLAVAGSVSTSFMQLFGINNIAVSAASQITRASKGMELVLVLDNTGSMNSAVNPSDSSTPKITALKSAASTLLDVLYGSNDTVKNLWVGVVPFSQAVNIGTSYGGWMDATYDATLDYGPILNGSSCQSYSGTSPATSGSYASTPSCTYSITGSSSAGVTASFTGNTANWGGCVMARSAPYDTSDDTPATASFQAYAYPYSSDAGITYDPWRTTGTPVGKNCTGSGSRRTCTSYTTATTYIYSYQSSLPGTYGPSLFCPQPVLPMVAEKATVINEINSLSAGGSTLIDIGMAWGWRMLSPKWQGLWGGEMNANNLPLPYNTALMNKVVILMTDGMNSMTGGNFTAYNYLDKNVLGTTSVTTATTTLDTRTLAVCNNLKANGVLIYTIGFGTNGNNDPSDPTSVNGPLLQACASKPEYYFLAPTNAELQSAFQQIGDSLANLRISQ